MIVFWNKSCHGQYCHLMAWLDNEKSAMDGGFDAFNQRRITTYRTSKGLPSHLYVDDTATAEERERVFFSTWSAITHGKNAPEPGSVMPVDFLGMPLLVVRNKQGEIKVFENVCRHRGMRLVDAPGKLKGPITCPYHAWAYDLDGALESHPPCWRRQYPPS